MDNTIQDIILELGISFDNFDETDLMGVADLIRNNKDKNIYLLGVGKNEHLCRYFSDILKSLNYRAFFLNFGNLLHGDIGCIRSDDIVIFMSNSGNTEELVKIMKILVRWEESPFLVSVTANKDSLLSRGCCLNIVIPKMLEIDGGFNMVPCTSVIAFQLAINRLIYLINDIDLNKYNQNHPRGDIGNKLCKISDVIIPFKDCPVVNDNASLKDVIIEMLNKNLGCCLVSEEDKKIVGIVTDYDIRKFILKSGNLDDGVDTIMNRDFCYETDVDERICDVQSKFLYIPVLGMDKSLIGLINNKI